MKFKNVVGRIRQLGRAMTARPLSGSELEYIRQILSPAQQPLFVALPVYEQGHAFNVCCTLVEAGFGSDQELLQAALLHDLGKRDPLTGQTIPVWVKVANVVVRRAFGPALVERLGQNRPGSWRYLFWLQASHEERGARLVQAAGSSLRVVDLVGGTRDSDQAGQALQWADDLN